MDRERLTITLRNDILRRLDSLIDGITLRNRSHAIETLLEKALQPKVKQAVILAGGQGVKMRPLTYEIPKGLIPVRGKPILEYLVELLREHNVRKIVLAIGHLGEKIVNHFHDGSKFGVKITYSKERRPLGTGGALRKAKSMIDSQMFLVLHGDILVDIDLSALISFHCSQHKLGTIALTTRSDATSFGSVQLRGSRIVNFIEKPEKKKIPSYLVNSGIYVFEPEIFDYLPKKGTVMLEEIFPRLAKEGKLAGFAFEGKWLDVSTPKDYEQAIKSWK